jgi:hypothetical protein
MTIDTGLKPEGAPERAWPTPKSHPDSCTPGKQS